LELTEIAISGLMSFARKGGLVTDGFCKGVRLVLAFKIERRKETKKK